MKGKRRKKINANKKTSNLHAGVTVTKTIQDPLAGIDFENAVFEHKMQHCFDRAKLINMATAFLNTLERYNMTYLLQVECEFFSPVSNEKYFRGFDMVVEGVFSKSLEIIYDEIESVFRVANMTQYVTTHLTLKILGNIGVKKAWSKQ